MVDRRFTAEMQPEGDQLRVADRRVPDDGPPSFHASEATKSLEMVDVVLLSRCTERFGF